MYSLPMIKHPSLMSYISVTLWCSQFDCRRECGCGSFLLWTTGGSSLGTETMRRRHGSSPLVDGREAWQGVTCHFHWAAYPWLHWGVCHHCRLYTVSPTLKQDGYTWRYSNNLNFLQVELMKLLNCSHHLSTSTEAVLNISLKSTPRKSARAGITLDRTGIWQTISR